MPPEPTPAPDLAAVLAELRAIREALDRPAVPPVAYDLDTVLRITSQSKTSVYRGISAGTFPPPASTPSGPRWSAKSIEAWAAKLRPGRRRARSADGA